MVGFAAVPIETCPRSIEDSESRNLTLTGTPEPQIWGT
jgi:hypothetical protein